MHTEHLQHLVSRRLGIEVPYRDVSSLSEMVVERCRVLGLASDDAYLQLLESQSLRSKCEWQELAKRLTTGETYFFRDAGHNRLLQEHLLPSLLHRCRNARSLRIWSAGCSSGEEPYSLAIMLDELLTSQRWNISILATDINTDALAAARRGCYSEWSFRQTDPDRRRRYFHMRDNEWEVDERIRSMVTFQPLNLLEDVVTGSQPRDIDLIVCRNVFIYFSKATVGTVVERMSEALSEDGYLLTAHAELRGQQFSNLKPEVFPDAVVYRKENNRSDRTRLLKAAVQSVDVSIDQSPDRQNSPSMSGGAASSVSTRRTDVPTLPSAESALHDRSGDPTHERLLAGVNQNLQSMLDLARSHANISDHIRATECCHEAMRLAPLSAAPQYLFAHILEETGRHHEAAAALQKVLYLDPDHVAAHLDLAELCDREGDKEQAQRLRNAAVRILVKMPDDAAVIEYHGSVTVAELARQIEELTRSA